MNINLIKLKSLTIELRGIRSALDRIAECMEMDLLDRGLRTRAPIDSKPESTMEYTDEEMDWARENIERVRRMEEQIEQDNL